MSLVLILACCLMFVIEFYSRWCAHAVLVEVVGFERSPTRFSPGLVYGCDFFRSESDLVAIIDQNFMYKSSFSSRE